MRYIACNTNSSRTKLIKLMYFMEEEMVTRFGVPFLGLKYEVWQYGPVNKDVYVSLSNNGELFSDFVRDNGNNEPVSCIGSFEDDEFSDVEIEVMKNVLKNFGKHTAHQLVQLTHKEGTLWYSVAKKNGVLDSLISNNETTTELSIDFSDLLPEDRKSFYTDCLNIRIAANEARANAGV